MGTRERKKREKQARRKEIIDAAEALFLEKGYTVVTVDEIAARAELSKGTLYLYYKSKHDLYATTALRGSEILRTMISEAASTAEHPLKLLFNILNAYYTYFMEYRAYYRISCLPGNAEIHGQTSEKILDACVDAEKRIRDIVSSVVQRAIDEGIMRHEVQALEAAVMLLENSDSLMRLMDHNEKRRLDIMGLRLEDLLRKSNRLLIQGMLTEKGKQKLVCMFGNAEEFLTCRQAGSKEKVGSSASPAPVFNDRAARYPLANEYEGVPTMYDTAQPKLGSHLSPEPLFAYLPRTPAYHLKP